MVKCLCGERACYGFKNSSVSKCAKCREPDMVRIKLQICLCSRQVRPSFAKEGESPICCSSCKTTEMINVSIQKCEKCKKISPSYGDPEIKKMTRCSKCKDPNMIDLKSSKCLICKVKEASYGKENGKRTHCLLHKETDMIDLKHRLCIKCNKTFPTYGLLGGKPICCVSCKDTDMIDLNNQKCVVCCNTRANFGLALGKPTHCRSCKTDEMKNYICKKCDQCDIKRPYYGLKDTNEPTRCKLCRDINMIPIRKYGCKNCGNTKNITAFGIEGSEKPTHCKNCCSDDMIYMYGHKCVKCNKKSPKFGIESKKPTHCQKCAEPGMTDVVSRHCIFPSCKILNPSYGKPGNTTQHCATHKEEGEIIHPNKKCITQDCNEIAIFGTINATHCELHATLDQTDWVQRKCVSCSLPEILNIDNLCKYCGGGKDNRLAKQIMVKQYFDNNEMKYTSNDKIVDLNCGRERPDFVFDGNYHKIVVEVDENQHNHITKECENNRMINITGIMGCPTIFIRFNPDKYKPSKGNTQETSMKKRLNELQSVVNYWITNKTPQGYTTSVIYMYYNDDNKNKWVTPQKLY